MSNPNVDRILSLSVRAAGFRARGPSGARPSRGPTAAACVPFIQVRNSSVVSMAAVCPSTNAAGVEQAGFFSPGGSVDWDAHRIGWAIAGATTIVTWIFAGINVIAHCRSV
jgi:hypothetical protein